MNVFWPFVVSLVVQIIMVTYAATTQQWGYLVGTVFWAVAVVWLWRRERHWRRRYPGAYR